MRATASACVYVHMCVCVCVCRLGAGDLTPGPSGAEAAGVVQALVTKLARDHIRTAAAQAKTLLQLFEGALEGEDAASIASGGLDRACNRMISVSSKATVYRYAPPSCIHVYRRTHTDARRGACRCGYLCASLPVRLWHGQECMFMCLCVPDMYGCSIIERANAPERVLGKRFLERNHTISGIYLRFSTNDDLPAIFEMLEEAAKEYKQSMNPAFEVGERGGPPSVDEAPFADWLIAHPTYSNLLVSDFPSPPHRACGALLCYLPSCLFAC